MRLLAALALLAAAGVAFARVASSPAPAIDLAGLGPLGSSDVPPGATELSDGAGWVTGETAAPWAAEPGARSRAAAEAEAERIARWAAEGRPIVGLL